MLYTELCKSSFPTTWNQVHILDLGSLQGLMNFNCALIPRISRKSEPVLDMKGDMKWHQLSRTEGTIGSCNWELDQRLYKMYILRHVRVLIVSAHAWTSPYKKKYRVLKEMIQWLAFTNLTAEYCVATVHGLSIFISMRENIKAWWKNFSINQNLTGRTFFFSWNKDIFLINLTKYLISLKLYLQTQFHHWWIFNLCYTLQCPYRTCNLSLKHRTVNEKFLELHF